MLLKCWHEADTSKVTSKLSWMYFQGTLFQAVFQSTLSTLLTSWDFTNGARRKEHAFILLSKACGAEYKEQSTMGKARGRCIDERQPHWSLSMQWTGHGHNDAICRSQTCSSWSGITRVVKMSGLKGMVGGSCHHGPPTVECMCGTGESMPLDIIILMFPPDQRCRKDLLLFAVQVHGRGRRQGGSRISREKGDLTSDFWFPAFELSDRSGGGGWIESLYLPAWASGRGGQLRYSLPVPN